MNLCKKSWLVEHKIFKKLMDNKLVHCRNVNADMPRGEKNVFFPKGEDEFNDVQFLLDVFRKNLLQDVSINGVSE
jgi:hypothetical protein